MHFHREISTLITVFLFAMLAAASPVNTIPHLAREALPEAAPEPQCRRYNCG
ncbi:hypothetical protein FA15DRAFT_706134 [Coprinopsis marcescibilis]|uniref:Uncharacterized protein n=1 Tax=Coprinopsis marcescibilis TaxID=230819 RepID=A0A5C3KQA4_COPMA|nr:hypothetical protein FA15DRAFT_706134 [Coprinopsis marcescibilis]